MAWTTPITWTDNQVVDATDMNEQVRDNLNYLKDAVDSIIVLQDQKSATTDGGTFTSGAWQTRTLNTEVTDVNGNCTLSSNQFTLDAGTYEILAIAPAYRVDDNQTRLQNTTGATTVLTGTSVSASSTNNVNVLSVIMGRFTVAAAQALEIQHYGSTTQATDGFGRALGQITEVYTTVWLRKVA